MGQVKLWVPQQRMSSMRSYPGMVSRVLRDKSIRGPAARAVNSTSTTGNIAAAQPARQQQLPSVQGLWRAVAPRYGQRDGEDGENTLRRWGALSAAAATAAALGADGIVDNNHNQVGTQLTAAVVSTRRRLKAPCAWSSRGADTQKSSRSISLRSRCISRSM